MIPYRFRSDRRSRMMNGPNISKPQYVKGGEGSNCSLGRSASRCIDVLPRRILHFTHLEMMNLTKEFPLIIQKPLNLSSFKVELRPACCNARWKCSMIRFVVIHLLGRMIGCLMSNDTSASRIRPPTRRIPLLSTNGHNLNKGLLLFTPV